MGGGARTRLDRVVTMRGPPRAGPSRDDAGAWTEVLMRAARRDDLDDILAIEREAFTDPWSRGAFAVLFDDPRVYFAVAVGGDDRPRAYLAAWFVADEGEVATLAVAAQYRGRGMATRLLESVLAEAGRRGAATLYLEVRESNEAARRLYASHGFEEVGRRRHYYRRPREDARVLRKVLTAP